ncbi:MAG: ABC transporter substrate-binding protein [Clostridiales bacterium]|jgi:peptide/nickel transport system substrate-binding protein|nr:ABC transporter substrate-binding protein [Clostridiales bacterium]
MKKMLCAASMLAILTLAGCSVTKDDISKKNTLYLSLRTDIETLDPLYSSSEGSGVVMQALFMNLFYYAIQVDEVRSDACESWEVSSDAMEYTFNLKRGIKFHNGEELKAQDVAYSVNALMEIPGKVSWTVMIDKAEVQNDYEVKITLKEPNASFLRRADIVLLHEKTTEEAGESFGLRPIGSGPYEFVSYEPGVKLILKAYSDYIGQKVAFENVQYEIESDPSAAIAAAEAGESDFILSTAFYRYDALEANPKLSVVASEYGEDYIIMNNRIAPFDNSKVRLAINHAIDKGRCSYMFTGGLAKVPTSLVLGIQSERLPGYPYDVELAKKYLAVAGYPGGEGFPEIEIKTLETYKAYAEVIKSNLQDIGINSQIALEEPEALVPDLMGGKVPFSVIAIGLGFDPSAYSDMLTSTGSFNLARYSNSEVDALYAKAISETDDAARKELLVKTLEMVQEDAPYGLLCTNLRLFIYNNRLDFSEALRNRSGMYIRPQDVRKK